MVTFVWVSSGVLFSLDADLRGGDRVVQGIENGRVWWFPGSFGNFVVLGGGEVGLGGDVGH